MNGGGGRTRGRRSREKRRIDLLLRLQGPGLKRFPACPLPSSTQGGACGHTLGEGCREAGPGIEKLDRGQDKPGCLRTPVGWALEDTPRAHRLQVPAEPGQVQPEVAQQRRLLAAALPAGRGGASRAGLPICPGSPRVSHSRPGSATAPAVGSENVGGRGMSPGGGPRPFQAPPVPLILPCTPRTLADPPTQGLPPASPGPALGKRAG